MYTIFFFAPVSVQNEESLWTWDSLHEVTFTNPCNNMLLKTKIKHNNEKHQMTSQMSISQPVVHIRSKIKKKKTTIIL